MRSRLILGTFVLLLGNGPALSSDFENAPEPFMYQANHVVPADFQSVDLALTFDYERRVATGKAVISFQVGQAGFPMFDLVRSIHRVAINGIEVSANLAETINDPDRVTKFRVLKQLVEPGSVHTLEIDYDLTPEVDFTSGRIRTGFFMSDLQTDGRGFWEKYAPSSFEWDHFNQVVDVQLKGVSRDHILYANGEIENLGKNSWRVVYPSYFTTSSFYFHLTEAGRFVERNQVYMGLEREIPVKVYAESSSLASNGMRNSLSVLKELEATYGPFPHREAIVYVTPSGGGMEYGGATMTSMYALEHEFTHFWFARGVMPANGNAGWIDEAIASWRDNGYPRANRPPSGSPHNLGGFSQYRRHTTQDAYTLGAGFISELDKQFENLVFDGQRGMRGILRTLFTRHKHESITVHFFKDFLEDVTGADLTNTFERYVFGRGKFDEDCGGKPCSEEKLQLKSNHPRPYTLDEVRRFR